MRKTSPTSFPSSSGVLVLAGRTQILSQEAMLEDLARRFEQATAMNGLAYYLNRPENLKKQPYLVLVSSSLQKPDHIDPEQILGAVLLYEYCVFGVGTGVFAAADCCGHRSVVAPRHLREYVTSIACSELLHRKAHFVQCSFQQDLQADAPAEDATPFFLDAPPSFGDLSGSWAARSRNIPDHLPLQATYDATLATLGKRTRHHLRLYRKRAETDFACEYVPDAVQEVRREDLVGINAGSLNPIPQDAYNLQWDGCAKLNGGFISGLRSKDGEWLALIGGWRQDQTTVLQWQTNRAGYEKSSLSVAARAFLLEHEVAVGQKEFRVEGGTPHSLANSFVERQVVDLLVRRHSLCALVALRMAASLWNVKALRLKGNFLAEAVVSSSLLWHSAGRSRRKQAQGAPQFKHT